jgi:hypothetical protein
MVWIVSFKMLPSLRGQPINSIWDNYRLNTPAVLLDEVAGELGEAIAIGVTMKDRTEDVPEIATG